MTRYDDETLEAAAEMLEKLGGNSLYQYAWRAGAKKIRELKLLKNDDAPSILNESDEQISESLSRPV